MSERFVKLDTYFLYEQDNGAVIPTRTKNATAFNPRHIKKITEIIDFSQYCEITEAKGETHVVKGTLATICRELRGD